MSTKLLSVSIIIWLMLSSCSTQKEVLSTKNMQSPQEKVDISKITETIDMYFEGWMTGDTTLLGTAMHRTCQLKNIKDDDVIIFDRATYLGFFKPRPRRQNAGGKIVSINVTDDIAAAKCEIHTADRLFTDYFNMMKVGGQWYIVDKIAMSKERITK